MLQQYADAVGVPDKALANDPISTIHRPE